MLGKTISLFLALLIISFVPVAALAQDNSWDGVKALAGKDIAVRKADGATVFGRLVSADDKEIALRVAGREQIDSAPTTIARDAVKKVWLAELRFGKRSPGKGALIGAATGLAIGFAIYLGLPRNESTDGLEGVAIPMGAGIGAGVGAVAGFFIKKGHKKGKLIYRA